MQKISAYILTYNEAEKIEAAVSSVLWADEVVVVDSFSTDRTTEIATALGARVVQVPFNGFGDLRNRAIEACKYDWILSLDADERCTENVRDEILKLLAAGPALDVYRVPRRSLSMEMAFDCSSLRCVSSMRSFWLRNVFTCTGR
jgi:glycosyltransferase involved in cell wall biosynthesis